MIATRAVFIYFIHGPEIYYHEAAASLYSLLRAASEDIDSRQIRIVIASERGAYFKSLPWIADRVDVIHLDGAELERMMQGPQGAYVHLAKLRLLERLLGEVVPRGAVYSAASAVLYVDSDTFFYENPRAIIDACASGTERFMYEFENDFVDDHIKPPHAAHYLNQILGEDLEYIDAAGVSSIHRWMPSDQMWNAGVIGLCSADLPLIRRAIRGTCALLGAIPRTDWGQTIEQFALSVEMARAGELRAVKGPILHYWWCKKQLHHYIAQWVRGNASFTSIPFPPP